MRTYINKVITKSDSSEHDYQEANNENFNQTLMKQFPNSHLTKGLFKRNAKKVVNKSDNVNPFGPQIHDENKQEMRISIVNDSLMSAGEFPATPRIDEYETDILDQQVSKFLEVSKSQQDPTISKSYDDRTIEQLDKKFLPQLKLIEDSNIKISDDLKKIYVESQKFTQIQSMNYL